MNHRLQFPIPAVILFVTALLRASGQTAGGPVALPDPLPVEEIVRRLLDRSDGTSNRVDPVRYSFRRTTVTEELDGQDQVKTRRTKEHLVTVVGEEQSSVLVKVDGVVPSESKRQREQRSEEGRREQFGPRRDRSSRPANRLDRELLERFQYRLVGTEPVEGRWAYLLAFEPRPDAPGGSISDRVLARLQGRMWVDAADMEPARIETSLRESVAIGVFLAVLDDFQMVVRRRRLASGVWVDEAVDTSVGGRKLVQRFRGRMELLQDDFISLPASGPDVPLASP